MIPRYYDINADVVGKVSWYYKGVAQLLLPTVPKMHDEPILTEFIVN